MHLTLRRALTVVVFLATIVPALAQDLPGSVEAGRRLAQNWCSACHRIDASSVIINTAPDFSLIADMPSTTALSLKVFLQTSHDTMPNYQLTRTDTDNVIAYILSLKKK